MAQFETGTGTQAEASTAEDLALLHRAQAGDFSAYESLVARYERRLHALAWRIVGQKQDAEDVVQKAFLSLIENLDSFREESSVATWILRIATNHALKILRKRRGLPTVSLEVATHADDSYTTMPHPDYIAEWRDDPVELVQQAETRHLIDGALADLEEKYRLVFVLRDIEGLTVKETAEALDLTEANVKVRLLRARLQLRERLTRALGDDANRVVSDHPPD